MEILKVHQTKNPCYKKNQKANHVGILVHSTGAVNRTLKRYVDAPERLGTNLYNNHWNKSSADKAVHAFIGYDKDNNIIVAETLPLDIACWGCGKGKNGSYNRNPVAHIQFEICQGSNTDSDYYHKAIAVAEDYCVHLCKLYGWDASVICSHQAAARKGYASNHSDPDSWMKHFGDHMSNFRSRVQAKLGGDLEVKETEIEIKTDYDLTQFIKDVQKACGAKVDGIAGPETLSKTVTISAKKNRTHPVVKIIQRRLDDLGYTEVGDDDGIAGPKFTSAVKHFQTDNKCRVVDGEITAQKTTWRILLGME